MSGVSVVQSNRIHILSCVCKYVKIHNKSCINYIYTYIKHQSMWTYTTCKCLSIQYTYIPPYQKYTHPGVTKTFKPCRSLGIGWSFGTKSLWISGVNNPYTTDKIDILVGGFQQIWKVWSSIWIMKPQGSGWSRGEIFAKYLKPPHRYASACVMHT